MNIVAQVGNQTNGSSVIFISLELITYHLSISHSVIIRKFNANFLLENSAN